MVLRSSQRHHCKKRKRTSTIICQEQCSIFGDNLEREVLPNLLVLLVKSSTRVKNRVDIQKSSLMPSLDVVNHMKDTSDQSTTSISKLIEQINPIQCEVQNLEDKSKIHIKVVNKLWMFWLDECDINGQQFGDTFKAMATFGKR
jgi:hypothetical protein